MADYKRQHTVAKSYLRGFVLNEAHGGTFKQYDKENGKSCFVKPEDASIWKYGYSFRRSDGSWNHNAEHGLGAIENKAVPAIRRLVSGRATEKADRYNIALFLVSSLRRPKQMVNSFMEAAITETQDPRWNKVIIQKVEKDLGRAFSAKERAECSRLMKEKLENQSTDEVKARQFDVWFKSIPDHARSFMTLEWKVLTAKRPFFFVTSDSPACTRLIGDPDGKMSHYVVMSDPRVELSMPLSHSHFLLARHEGWSEPQRASKSRVQELNARTIRMAQRFIWSPKESRKMDLLFQTHMHFERPMPNFGSLWENAYENACIEEGS